MAVNATGIRFTLPGRDAVLGVELGNVAIVDDPAELRGAPSQVDPLGIGLPHDSSLLLGRVIYDDVRRAGRASSA
jgi:hypothetical protein